MPGAFRFVHYFPRHRYIVGLETVYAPEPWGVMKSLVPLPRHHDDGVFAIESVPSQNYFDYAVYTRPGPIGFLQVGYEWRREAWRVVEHPIFLELLVMLYGSPERLYSSYEYGHSQVELLARNVGGPMAGIAYIMLDYSGSVDAWLRTDRGMAPGTYHHFRLHDVHRPDDWYMATGFTYFRLVFGTPEPHSRI